MQRVTRSIDLPHPTRPTPTPAADGDEVAALIADGLVAGGGWMAPASAEALLRSVGLPVAESRSAATPSDVRLAAEDLGGPVALKAIGPGLLHKSDVGAVRLDLTAAGAERAAVEMCSSLTAAGVAPEGFLLQRMAPSGPELIVGVVGDPRFGPLVAVGAGGTTAELIGDVQVRLAPVGPREAASMLRELRTFPLLDGFRGAPRADVRSGGGHCHASGRARRGPPGDRGARLQSSGRWSRRCRHRGRPDPASAATGPRACGRPQPLRSHSAQPFPHRSEPG